MNTQLFFEFPDGSVHPLHEIERNLVVGLAYRISQAQAFALVRELVAQGYLRLVAAW